MIMAMAIAKIQFHDHFIAQSSFKRQNRVPHFPDESQASYHEKCLNSILSSTFLVHVCMCTCEYLKAPSKRTFQLSNKWHLETAWKQAVHKAEKA